ncbi:SUN domain-containing protein 5-like [Caloenas nicobarica]|uniref:SUN domain-containing protein 5-like n=1 Tax=Caloenas nicobarica TaxID=187106 RepID=UPI0032B87D8B
MLVTCTSAGTKRQPEKVKGLNRMMKALKATMLVLLFGLFCFGESLQSSDLKTVSLGGVYHVAQLGTLTIWSTTEELGDPSEALSLPDQLHKLQEQLYHLHWSAKDITDRALQEGVKQGKLPGFTGWVVQEIINQALEKLEEIQVPIPDYALKSAGAAIIRSRTSPTLQTAKAKVFLYSLPVMDYMRSPELILEPENHPGNCWPFPGSQGHIFIKLSVPVIPRAVTMDHVSGTAFHGESLSGAPKDFAVYGFKEEHEEQGTFLGQFTFLAPLNPSQTFQLKNELPGVVNYIQLQVLSNWGHPDHTCLYRFRVHGAAAVSPQRVPALLSPGEPQCDVRAAAVRSELASVAFPPGEGAPSCRVAVALGRQLVLWVLWGCWSGWCLDGPRAAPTGEPTFASHGEEKGVPEKTPRGLQRLLGDQGRPRAGRGGSRTELLPNEQEPRHEVGAGDTIVEVKSRLSHSGVCKVVQ